MAGCRVGTWARESRAPGFMRIEELIARDEIGRTAGAYHDVYIGSIEVNYVVKGRSPAAGVKLAPCLCASTGTVS